LATVTPDSADPAPPEALGSRGAGTSAAGSRLSAASGDSDPVALFRYDAMMQAWWWSDEMFGLHGFRPGEVVPSTEVMLAHRPDDAAAFSAVLAGVLADGEPFCLRHRIIDADGEAHHVLAIGEGVSANGRVIAIRGYMIDVTTSLRRQVESEAAEAVTRSAQNRASIEQAKGALMGTYGVTEEEAFRLLRAYSNNMNVRLHTLAKHVTDELASPRYAGLTPKHRLGEILLAVGRRTSDSDDSPSTG